MGIVEQKKIGLRHKSAEPEDYIWLSNGVLILKIPQNLLSESLSSEEKFTEAKYLFDTGNPDVYCENVSQ